MSESEQANPKHSQTGQTKKDSAQLAVIVILVILSLYTVLVVISVCHPGLNGQRLKFGMESGLTLAIVITVIAQVIINYGQWRESQRSLQISQSAYVGLQKIEWEKPRSEDHVPNIIYLKIGNTGNIPASQVFAKIEVMAFMPELWAKTPNARPGEHRKTVYHHSGSAKLFRSNLPILVKIELEDFLKLGEVTLIHQTYGFIAILGEVRYWDGFGNQTTDFFFTYDGNDIWVSSAPDAWKDRVEAAKREKERDY